MQSNERTSESRIATKPIEKNLRIQLKEKTALAKAAKHCKVTNERRNIVNLHADDLHGLND